MEKTLGIDLSLFPELVGDTEVTMLRNMCDRITHTGKIKLLQDRDSNKNLATAVDQVLYNTTFITPDPFTEHQRELLRGISHDLNIGRDSTVRIAAPDDRKDLLRTLLDYLDSINKDRTAPSKWDHRVLSHIANTLIDRYMIADTHYNRIYSRMNGTHYAYALVGLLRWTKNTDPAPFTDEQREQIEQIIRTLRVGNKPTMQPDKARLLGHAILTYLNSLNS